MLRQRFWSVVVLVPVLLAVLALGEPWIAAATVLIAVIAAFETFRLLGQAGYPALTGLGVVLAAAVVADVAAPGQLDGSGALLAAVGLVIVAVGAFGRRDPRDGLTAWAVTVFGALYVGQLGFVVRLGQAAPALPNGVPLAPLGPDRSWILLLILGVWAYDTGAYFIGRRFGRARFLTHISPSKTYAGLIGGVIACSLVVAALLWGLGQPVALALALGPLLALAAQAGDLAESMLKRAAGAKDSGTLIPGHGGMLDRVDSFLFAAPLVTLFVVALIR